MKLSFFKLLIFLIVTLPLQAQKYTTKLHQNNYDSINPFICLNQPKEYKIENYSIINYSDSVLNHNIYYNLPPFDENFSVFFPNQGQVATIQDIIIKKPNNEFELLNNKINIFLEDSVFTFYCQEVAKTPANSIDTKGKNYGLWVYNYWDNRNNCIYQKKGIYKNGLKVGEWEEKNTCGFKKITLFDSSGNRIRETDYYSNGNIKLIRNLKLDHASGPYLEYYEKGKIKIKGQYKIHKTDTSFIVSKTDDYSIESTTINTSPVKDGIWIYYKSKGKIFLKEFYKMGKLIRKEEF